LATRRLLYGRKCRHHSGAATSVSLRLCAMIHAIAGSSAASGSTSRSMTRAFS
jgi:hypothetical protein